MTGNLIKEVATNLFEFRHEFSVSEDLLIRQWLENSNYKVMNGRMKCSYPVGRLPVHALFVIFKQARLITGMYKTTPETIPHKWVDGKLHFLEGEFVLQFTNKQVASKFVKNLSELLGVCK